MTMIIMKIEINCTKNHDVYDIIDDYNNSNSTYHNNEGNDDNDTITIMITMAKR